MSATALHPGPGAQVYPDGAAAPPGSGLGQSATTLPCLHPCSSTSCATALSLHYAAGEELEVGMAAPPCPYHHPAGAFYVQAASCRPANLAAGMAMHRSMERASRSGRLLLQPLDLRVGEHASQRDRGACTQPRQPQAPFEHVHSHQETCQQVYQFRRPSSHARGRRASALRQAARRCFPLETGRCPVSGMSGARRSGSGGPWGSGRR